PNPAIPGVHGEGLLDSSGHPQAVEFADAKQVPSNRDLWVPSEPLERRLLTEFFARNHRYRTRGYREPPGPARFSTEWGSSVPEMKQEVAAWKSVDTKGLEYGGGKITLTDFVNWMRQPALARAFKAHSNGLCSVMEPPADFAAFDRMLGPYKWRWTRK